MRGEVLREGVAVVEGAELDEKPFANAEPDATAIDALLSSFFSVSTR